MEMEKVMMMQHIKIQSADC